jgi:hypothetical protein
MVLLILLTEWWVPTANRDRSLVGNHCPRQREHQCEHKKRNPTNLGQGLFSTEGDRFGQICSNRRGDDDEPRRKAARENGFPLLRGGAGERRGFRWRRGRRSNSEDGNRLTLASEVSDGGRKAYLVLLGTWVLLESKRIWTTRSKSKGQDMFVKIAAFTRPAPYIAQTTT